MSNITQHITSLLHTATQAVLQLTYRKGRRSTARHDGRSGRDSALQLFVEELIGAPTQNPHHYQSAFTHRSYLSGSTGINNERLEFLGDSVLSCVVGHILCDMYSEYDEGMLTSLRAQIVSRSNLNNLAIRMRLDTKLRASGHINLRQTDLMGNTLEALIGAIYLDKGFDFAASFVRKHIVISRKNTEKVQVKEEDYKTEFIILMQQHKIPFEFKHIDSHKDEKLGIVHRCQLTIGTDEHPLTTGVATSKKGSHQNAAKDALKCIKRNPDLLKRYAGTAPKPAPQPARKRPTPPATIKQEA